MRKFNVLFLLFCSLVSFAEIQLDGSLDEPQWADAQVFNQMFVVRPFSLQTPDYETEIKVFVDAKALYFGITNYQPTELNNSDSASRDSFISSDKIQLVIDFENNGISAYSFEVGLGQAIRDGIFSNENQFSNEWDGQWKAKTNSGENSWVAEIMIPWEVVSMKNNTANKRELRWYVARSIANKGLTFANVKATNTRSQFLSEFAVLSVDDFSTSSFQLFSYATARQDILNKKSSIKAGVDMFWKSGTGKQLTATVNPDFGQIESDRLVVNFSATETFFSERRPFFTENQSLFNVRGANNLRFIHTRRIGARPDLGGQKASDIDVAVKYTDKHSDFSYGMFAAVESDGDGTQGRDYFAGRFLQKKDNYAIGLTTTYVNRPDIERNATGYALDYEYNWADKFKLNTQLVASDVTDKTGDYDENGMGMWMTLNHQISQETQQSLRLSHYAKEFEINDFGFLPRNDLNTISYNYDVKDSDFEEGSKYRQKQNRYSFEHVRNDSGDRLYSYFSYSKRFTFQDSSGFGWDFGLFSNGLDDLISRGNGLVNTDSGHSIGTSYNSNNANKLRYHASIRRSSDFSTGVEYSTHIHPSYYFKENMNVSLSISYRSADNWLNWLVDTSFGRYKRQLINSNVDFNVNFAQKQELRFRLQWLAIDAQANNFYQLDNQGDLIQTNDAINDFSLSRTSLQLRYKYEVAPLSNIYVVYSRGARIFNESSQSLSSLFSPGFDNISSNNFLIKYRHQFF